MNPPPSDTRSSARLGRRENRWGRGGNAAKTAYSLWATPIKQVALRILEAEDLLLCGMALQIKTVKPTSPPSRLWGWPKQYQAA